MKTTGCVLYIYMISQKETDCCITLFSGGGILLLQTIMIDVFVRRRHDELDFKFIDIIFFGQKQI